MHTIKIKVSEPPTDGYLVPYAGQTIEVDVSQMVLDSGMFINMQGSGDIEIVTEKSESSQQGGPKGLPELLGQELKTLNVEFK